jgi:hypothetical protein
MKSLEVPADSHLVASTLAKQEAMRVEQQQLKKLVLDYEQRSKDEERRAEAMNQAGASAPAVPSVVTATSSEEVRASPPRRGGGQRRQFRGRQLTEDQIRKLK